LTGIGYWKSVVDQCGEVFKKNLGEDIAEKLGREEGGKYED
jgi:hypothetical protein